MAKYDIIQENLNGRDKIMSKKIFEKEDIIQRLECSQGKILEEIDNKGIFDHVQNFHRQKGIAGMIVEQCIFDHDADNKQEADLMVIDGNKKKKVELKTTGMVISMKPKKHYIAKEPMSITAVGVYDIADQDFYSSHFWEKIEHMLIVYYHYDSDHTVPAIGYKKFPLVGYEFHEFSAEDIEGLKNDWENVRDLCEEIVSRFPGERNQEWKALVKEEYIKEHGRLRKALSYINLAPKFPPRFRLRKPFVSNIIANHFGYDLEQLPGRYASIADIDKKCEELTLKYKGRSIGSLAKEFGISNVQNKSIAEPIVVSMFGGEAKKLNEISLFKKYGLIGKTIVITAHGEHTEDMKLFRLDLDEIMQKIIEGDQGYRPYQFEDSELYSYFMDHEFLCIIFQEPELTNEKTISKKDEFGNNKFVGFKRLVMSDEFIDKTVRKVWDDTREKVSNKTLVDVVQTKKDGSVIINKNGEISTAPNFIKSKENDVFIRGSGVNSAQKNECVNGIKMYPQYVWIKGSAVVKELGLAN